MGSDGISFAVKIRGSKSVMTQNVLRTLYVTLWVNGGVDECFSWRN